MIDHILQTIDEEIARLRQARSILAVSVKPTPVETPAKPERKRKRRKLSAAARKAIADAQVKRWAKVRSGNKAAAKKETAAA